MKCKRANPVRKSGARFRGYEGESIINMDILLYRIIQIPEPLKTQ